MGTQTIGSAELLGEILSGEGFTKHAVSAQFSTMKVDGAWPGTPTSPAPTSSIEVPVGSVTRQVDGSYLGLGLFKIDSEGFFNDPNARVSYWVNTLAELEIEPGPNETPETLILSWLRVDGTENGEPYICEFFSHEFVLDAGAGRTRAVVKGTIARSTFKGGRGLQDARRYLALAQAA